MNWGVEVLGRGLPQVLLVLKWRMKQEIYKTYTVMKTCLVA
jgi:hypothetical protein